MCLSSIFLSKLLLWLRITFFWVSCQHLFKILNNKFLVKMTVLTTNCCFLSRLFFLLKFNIFSTILLFNNEWQDKYSNFLFEITDLPDSNNNTHRFHILLLLFYLPNHLNAVFTTLSLLFSSPRESTSTIPSCSPCTVTFISFPFFSLYFSCSIHCCLLLFVVCLSLMTPLSSWLSYCVILFYTLYYISE